MYPFSYKKRHQTGCSLDRIPPTEQQGRFICKRLAGLKMVRFEEDSFGFFLPLFFFCSSSSSLLFLCLIRLCCSSSFSFVFFFLPFVLFFFFHFFLCNFSPSVRTATAWFLLFLDSEGLPEIPRKSCLQPSLKPGRLGLQRCTKPRGN
jgi:hypothetical protein